MSLDRPLRSKGHFRKSAGFTVVEVVLTLTVIGIVASIAIPQMGSLQRTNQVYKAKTDLTNLRSAVRQLVFDHSDTTPAMKNWGYGTEGSPLTDPLAGTNIRWTKELIEGKDDYAWESGGIDVALSGASPSYLSAGGALLDPWGRPYYLRLYSNGTPAQHCSFILSRGPDGLLESSYEDYTACKQVRQNYPTGKDGFTVVADLANPSQKFDIILWLE